jgi:bifunctional DNase/RNase
MFPGANEQLLVLREADGPRRLSVIIGYHEATALWWFLKQEPCSRPLTHHAWVDTVAALGGSIAPACVVARREGTYFAELRLLREGQPVTIDVRPSDALLVALRAGAPFLFADSLWATDAVSEPEPT